LGTFFREIYDFTATMGYTTRVITILKHSRRIAFKRIAQTNEERVRVQTRHQKTNKKPLHIRMGRNMEKTKSKTRWNKKKKNDWRMVQEQFKQNRRICIKQTKNRPLKANSLFLNGQIRPSNVFICTTCGTQIKNIFFNRLLKDEIARK